MEHDNDMVGDQQLARLLTAVRSGNKPQSPLPEPEWPAGVSDEALPPSSLERVLNHLQDRRARVVQTARGELIRLVAAAAEQYGATAAWVFRPTVDGGFEAVASHTTQFADAFIPPGARCLVRRVFETSTPLFVPRVGDHPDYRNTIDETVAALSVPLGNGPGDAIGVLHLEVNREYVFAADMLNELAVLADEVTLQLQLLGPDRPNALLCWNPDRDGWTAKQVLADVCLEVKTALDTLAEVDAFHCTVWTVDAEFKEFYVCATSGPAHLYEAAEVLTGNTVVGATAAAAPGAVVKVRRSEPAEIEEPTAAGGTTRRPGPHLASSWAEQSRLLCRAVCFPVPVAAIGAAEEQLRLVVMITCYNEASTFALPDRVECSAVAGLLGRFMAGYLDLREELAVTRLRKAARTLRTDDPDFDPVLQVMIEVLRARGGTIYGRSPGNTQLRMLATTGLMTATGDPTEAEYDLARDNGFTCAVGRNPRNPLRWNRPGSHSAALPPRGTHKRPEDLGVVKPHLRRFLGYGIDDPDEPGRAQGIVRVLRAADDPPFTPTDCRVMARLAEELRALFRDWRRFVLWSPPVTPRVVAAVEASVRVFRPVPAGQPAKHLSDEMCRDLATAFAPYNVSQVGVVTLPSDSAGTPRLTCYHSDQYWPGEPDQPDPLAEPLPELEWRALVRNRQLVTFGYPSPVAGAVAGARVPFVQWTRDARPIYGVLSLDFAAPVEWKQELVELLHQAGRRLMTIWSRSAGWADDGYEPPIEPDDHARAIRAIRAAAVRQLGGKADVWVRHQGGYHPVGGRQVLDSRVERLRSQDTPPVEPVFEDGLLLLPLRIGTADAGLLVATTSLGADDPDRLWEAARWLEAEWCTVSFAAVTKVAVEQTPAPIFGRASGIVTRWTAETIPWSKSLFSDTAIGG